VKGKGMGEYPAPYSGDEKAEGRGGRKSHISTALMRKRVKRSSNQAFSEEKGREK